MPRDLVALVAPPDGYKHRRLAETDPKTIRILGQAVQKTGLGVTAYARPAKTDADSWAAELEAHLDLPDVVTGLSSLTDLPGELPEQAADLAHTRGRPLALHLSERIHEDMERALALEPRLLVHLNQATPQELEAMADAGVLAVSCPTSNRFFGLRPPLERLLRAAQDAGLPVALGTDNAMLSDGDLKDEARAVRTLLPEAPLDWVLRVMTWNAWQALALGPDPAHPGLLWGLHRKVPNTHPEETPVHVCTALFERPVHLGPTL